MRKLLAAVLAATGAVAMPALAQEGDGRGTVWSWFGDWDPSFYAGASVHQGTFEDWDTVSKVDSASFTTRDRDDEDTGLRISGGMKFLDNLAVEATYADFGGATFAGTSDGSGPNWEPGMQRDAIEASGIGLHLVGRLPVAGTFAVAARAGAWSLRSERRLTGTFDDAGTPTPYDIRDSGSSTTLGYGAALEYDGFAPIRVALEYDVAEIDGLQILDDGQVRSFGVSLKYVFSRPAGE